MERYPALDGFTLAADWSAGDAVWLIWPCRFEAWTDSYEHVCLTVAGLARTLAQYHTVKVIAPRQLATVARLQLGRDIEIVTHEVDDSWIADIGPMFLEKGDGTVAAIANRFNGWGNRFHSYERDAGFAEWLLDILGLSYYECPLTAEAGMMSSDGRGTVLACRDGLLDPHRNPTLNIEQVEDLLALYFGVRRVIWLHGAAVEGIAAGQVVPLARFVAPGRIALATCENRASPHSDTLAANREILRAVVDSSSRKLSLVEVPVPESNGATASEFPSYLGYRKLPDCLALPGFDDPCDEVARDILSGVFPAVPAVQVQMSVLAGHGTGLFGLLLPEPVDPEN